MDKKILVTGAAGFIGSHVVDDLLKLGFEVIGFDDLSGGSMDNVNEKSTFIKGDILDEKALKKIFEENEISHIFHLAAYPAVGLSHFIRKFNYQTNLIGSINLINLAIKNKVECFVFTSSISVYGEDQLPMTEDMIPMPEDPYGIGKFAVEQDLIAAKKMFGLNYIIFRPHNVYGERQRLGDKYRNVAGIFVNKIMENKPIQIFGDGKQTRAFTHIADISPIIAKSILNKKAYNEVFNIGSDKPYSIESLAKEIIESMDVDNNYPIQYEPHRNEIKHAFSDHSKIKEILEYKDTINLKEGIKRMVEWSKIQGKQQTTKFKNIEIEENLPPSWKDSIEE